MANVKNNSATQETRRRLLAAAGEVFADRGFHAATIKEITDRAGASLASVNYHFSDKAELYAAVLRRVADDAAVVVPPDDHLSGADAATRLRQFIGYFCRALMGRARAPWEQVLMARELAEPTEALDPVHDRVMRPLSRTLSGLIAELLDVPPAHEAVGLAAASVLGQCLYYMKQCAVIGRLHPQLGDRPDADRLAAHIVAFSLAGIRGQRRHLADTAADPVRPRTKPPMSTAVARRPAAPRR